MELDEQIRIIKELLEGVKELNGEYQDGWEDIILDAEKLIEFLNKEKSLKI